MMHYILVLYLAETGLIFFTVTNMGPCLGFVTKAALIIQGCISFCWAGLAQLQDLFSFSLHTTSEKPEDVQEVERGKSWGSQVTQEIFQNVWHHAQYIELGEEQWTGGHSKWSGLCVRCLNTCLHTGNGELISYFVLLSCADFALFIKPSWYQSTGFLTFLFQFSPPTLQRGGDGAAVGA